MNDSQFSVSKNTLSILERIAEGSSYEQVLEALPDCTYIDIFNAADEALQVLVNLPTQPPKAYTLAEKRKRHARAYEPWSPGEDQQLREFLEAGGTIAQIAGRLQRNRGAIRSRITKTNLLDKLSPNEQARLRRNLTSPIPPQPPASHP